MIFSITPKAYLLFQHAREQQQRLGRIADKTEDSVKLAHKKGLRLEHVTHRMPKIFEAKQRTKLARDFQHTDPSMKQHKQKVLTLRNEKGNFRMCL